MKIVPYILLGLLIVVAGLGVYYASDQKTTMEVLVSARRGLTGDVSGMEATNRDLETSAATTASTRSKELKQAKDQLAVTQEAVNKLDDAKRDAESAKADVESAQNELQEAKKRQEELAQMREAFDASIRAVPGLESADEETAVDTMNSKLEEYDSEIASLSAEKKKLGEQREQLNQDVSIAEVEYQKKKDTNDKFAEAYRNNGVEYSIAAVNPQWHFVIFSAGEDSGLIPGDTTPLLVQRDGVSITTLRIVRVNGGQIVAEYDEKKLPRGIVPEVGDLVLRKVPVGS